MGKKNKPIIALSLFALIATAGVAYLSSGFQKWDLTDWKDKVRPILPTTSDPSSEEPISSEEPVTSEEPIETRENLVKFNFESTVAGRELNATSAVTYLNAATASEINATVGTFDSLGLEVDREDAYVYKAFEDGYLKFGSSSALGYLGFEFQDFEFNAIKITASNYGALNNITGIYSCDNSGLKINDHDFGLLPTNAEDTTIAAAKETATHYFTDMQDQLVFETYGKRVFVYEIELWTDESYIVPFTAPDNTYGIQILGGHSFYDEEGNFDLFGTTYYHELSNYNDFVIIDVQDPENAIFPTDNSFAVSVADVIYDEIYFSFVFSEEPIEVTEGKTNIVLTPKKVAVIELLTHDLEANTGTFDVTYRDLTESDFLLVNYSL